MELLVARARRRARRSRRAAGRAPSARAARARHVAVGGVQRRHRGGEAGRAARGSARVEQRRQPVAPLAAARRSSAATISRRRRRRSGSSVGRSFSEAHEQDVEVAQRPRRARRASAARGRAPPAGRGRAAATRGSAPASAAVGDPEAMELLGVAAVADPRLRALDLLPLPLEQSPEFVDCRHFRPILRQRHGRRTRDGQRVAEEALAATCGRGARPRRARAGAGRRVLRLAEAVLEHLHDRDARVEPDQVGERERPDRVPEPELRDRVDRLGRRRRPSASA